MFKDVETKLFLTCEKYTSSLPSFVTIGFTNVLAMARPGSAMGEEAKRLKAAHAISLALCGAICLWRTTCNFTGIKRSSYRSPISLASASLQTELEEPIDVSPLLHSLAEDAKSIRLVQVGACDGDFEGTSSNDPVQSFLVAEQKVQAVLVEASPKVFATLTSNVHKTFSSGDRVRTVHAAVAPSFEREVPFYVVSERFKQDYPEKAFHWAMCQLNSMDREHILKHHVHLGLSRDDFQSYVEEILVCCKTPSVLLQDACMLPTEVDILAIDAEGLDDQILRAFLKLPGCFGGFKDGNIATGQMTS